MNSICGDHVRGTPPTCQGARQGQRQAETSCSELPGDLISQHLMARGTPLGWDPPHHLPRPQSALLRSRGGRGGVGKERTLPSARFLCSQAPAPCSESHSQGGVPLLEAISLPAAVGGPALPAEGEHPGLWELRVAAGATGAGARPRPQSREAFGAFCGSRDMLLRFVHVWHQWTERGCLLGRP